MSRRASIRSLIDTDASTAPAGAAGSVAGIASRAPSGGRRPAPRSCDEALRWLKASGRLVSRQVARALQEVKDGRLYRNDRLVSPVFNERELDDDPWRVSDCSVAATKVFCVARDSNRT